MRMARGGSGAKSPPVAARPCPNPRDLGVRSVSIVQMWTLVFGWPQLGLISPLRFLSWSGYILGSGVELN